ncbi:MAG TPA: hypothetical protein VGI22_07690 [Xanthobacteraceae bacterium]|jgi:hypothetical protein
MQKSSSLLVAGFIAIAAVVLVGRGWAQPSGAPQKSGTRRITLGTDQARDQLPRHRQHFHHLSA